MKTFKVEYSMCTGCFSAISTGQANATAAIFGASMCVKCSSDNTKFDNIKSIKVRTSYIETSV